MATTVVWKGANLYPLHNMNVTTCQQRIVFLVTLAIYAPLQLGGSLGHNLPTLLTCRLLTGIFGSARTSSI